MKKELKKTTIVFVFGIALCISMLNMSSATTDDQTTDELHFIIGTVGEGALTTIDPFAYVLSDEYTVIEQVCEGLFWRNPDNPEFPYSVPEPLLLETYEWQDDLTIDLTLRDNITFHDGTQLDAEALKWNFDRLHNIITYWSTPLATNYFINAEPYRGLDGLDLDWLPVGMPAYLINNTEIMGDYEVRLTLNVPYELVNQLVDFMVISPTAHADKLNATLEINDGLVGTGPFTFQKHSASDAESKFWSYEDYWQGAPKITNLTISYFTDDAARHTALISKDIDLMLGVDKTFFEEENVSHVVVDEGLIETYSAHVAMYDNVDIAVREAMNYAFDYQYFLEEISKNLTERSGGVIWKSILYHNDEIPLPDTDLDYARQVLIDAGIAPGEATSWTDQDWKDRASQNPLANYSFGYVAGMFDDTYTLTREAARSLGIYLEGVNFDAATFGGVMMSPNASDYWDMFPIGFGLDGFTPTEIFQFFYLSTAPFNMARISDAQIDDWFWDYMLAIDDEETRQDRCDKIANRVQNELFNYIFINQPKNYIAYNNKWGNVNPLGVRYDIIDLVSHLEEDTEINEIPGYSTILLGIVSFAAILGISKNNINSKHSL